MDPPPGQPGVLFVLDTLARTDAARMVLTLARALRRRGRLRPALACLGGPGELADAALRSGLDLHAGLLHHRRDVEVIRRLRRIFVGDIALPGGRSRLLPGEPPGRFCLRRGSISAAVVVESDPSAGRPTAPDRGRRDLGPLLWTSLARGLRRSDAPALLAWTRRPAAPGRRTVGLVNRLLVPRLDRILVPGPLHAGGWTGMEWVDPDRVGVLSDGLAVEELVRLGDRGGRADVRAELGAAADDVVVMCVADGPADLFCRAAERLLAGGRNAPAVAPPMGPPAFGPLIRARDNRNPGLRFWLIGGGEDRARTRELVRRLGLRRSDLVWMPDRADTARLWPAADIGVACSDRDSLAVSALEAMAAAAAFVSTAPPSCQGDGRTPERVGLLVPPGSLDALTHAIGRLVHDSNLRRRLGQTAAQHVRDHHNDDRMAEAFERPIVS